MYDRRRHHGERQGKAEKRQTERQGRRYKDWEKEAGYERRRNMRHRTSFEENTLDGKSSNTPPDYNNNNVDIYRSYKRNSSVGHHHPKISNAGNSIHHPLATSNGVVGHVGLMSNSSHGRVGGHGSKIPSR